MKKKIERDNEKYIGIYFDYLKKMGVSDAGIEIHCGMIDEYLNVYLFEKEASDMVSGCSLIEIITFIKNYVNVIVLPAVESNIDAYLNIISSFYKCMLENGYVTEEAYKDFVDNISAFYDEMIEDFYDKNPVELSPYDVAFDIEQARSFKEVYINIKTGKIIRFPFEKEVFPKDINEAYDDISNESVWKKLPEINDYEIMINFADEVDDSEISSYLINILNGDNGLMKFRDAIFEKDVHEEFFDYYEQAILDIAVDWLEEETGIDYSDDLEYEFDDDSCYN